MKAVRLWSGLIIAAGGGILAINAAADHAYLVAAFCVGVSWLGMYLIWGARD